MATAAARTATASRATRGRKSTPGRGVSVAHAVTRTTESPYRTTAAPPDCLANTPVSMDNILPETSASYTFPTCRYSLLGCPLKGRILVFWIGFLRLLAKAERFHNGFVPERLLRLQVGEQAPPLPDQFQQPTPGVEILGVGLQMIRDHVDPLGEERDLHFRRTGVRIVQPELADDVLFLLRHYAHFSPSFSLMA